MRAERLIATLLMLQQRGRLSARAIAEELEVSRRTVMRDLEALGSAGVPIYSVRGPAGGYELWAGFRAQLTGLTADELQALPLWGLPHAAEVMGLGEALGRARMKVAMSVPASMQDGLATIDGNFLHDPLPVGAPEPPKTLEFLSKAVRRRRVLRARHPSWQGRLATLYPLALVDKAGTWFLVADLGDSRRACTVGELEGLSTTGRRFHRPDDFNLSVFWREWLAEAIPAVSLGPS